MERGIYVPSDGMHREIPDDREIFSESETGEEITAYEEFLRGKCRAVIADDIYTDTHYRGTFLLKTEYLIGRQEGDFSLNDLLDEILNDMIEDWGWDEITEVQYALIDCGNDGKKQLALRAYGLAVEGAEDHSDLTMVFDHQDGKVAMIYAADTWSKWGNILCESGYIFGGSHDGANSHYAWDGIIGADGIYRKSHECHIELGHGLDEMSSYWEIWGEDGNEPFPPVEFYEYTINDKLIYAYYIPDEYTDEEKETILDYIKDNEKSMGVRFLTDDEAWKLVEKNRERLKITDETDGEENKIEWRALFSGWRAATAVSRTSLPEDFR